MSGIIAPRTYNPGDFIHEEKSFACVLSRSLKFVVCEKCLERSTALKFCKACLEVKYCSKTCQKADWRDHKLECKHLKNLTTGGLEEFVHLVGKVILKIKGKNWKNIQFRVLNTDLTFDDIKLRRAEKKESRSRILCCKEIKELTRQFIGEQNMPPEEDLMKIIETVENCRLGVRERASTMATHIFLGMGAFEDECIPNANFEVYQDTLRIWACKKIKKGSEKISLKSCHISFDTFLNLVTMESDCNCSDCSLPYGESVLWKIIDESRAFSVIHRTKLLLQTSAVLKNLDYFELDTEIIDQCLMEQEEVLGPTHILHLKVLELMCDALEFRNPYRLQLYLRKLEECVRMAYGEYSRELAPIYEKYTAVSFDLGDVLEGINYNLKRQKLETFNRR